MMESINPSLSQPHLKEELPQKPIKKRTVSLAKVKASRFRLMPITMTMLSLLLVLRVNDIYFDSMSLKKAFVANAQAAEEAKPEKAGDAKAEKKDSGADKKAEPAGSEMRPSEVRALKKLGEQTKYNQIELDLLQSLSKRRDELDVREKELGLKEKTLEATEKRITSRIDEMKKLQVEVQQLIEAYKEHQTADVKSLVKIYENMKPIDAATIFNELEMPILLSVIDAMSERKVAPILAAMVPKRAKEVTEELAELRKVKALPANASAATAP